MLQCLQTKQNIILQGPPGTGKTWLAKKLAYAVIGNSDDTRVRPVQFHPNLSYEDFVRGWRPQSDGGLQLVDGPFLQLASDAKQDPDARYVMVVEEINRGIPASIFGELLTLLEADKRNPAEALALAYPREPGERVHIPPNLYLIGTMNVADRSLAMVDFALRRRFAFFDLEPLLNDTWREWVHEQSGISSEFLGNVAAKMTELNRQIADDRNLGRQFRIGHSYVTPSAGVPINDPVEWFTQVVETEIVPLLHEYWFDSPDKVADARSKLLGTS
jgi:5-methylcytosine-specific restriction protein B